MAEYVVVAAVDQIVTKEISLLVVAGSEEEAQAFATSALNEYPDAVTGSHIKRIVTNKAHYWIPKSIDFKVVKEEKDSD